MMNGVATMANRSRAVLAGTVLAATLFLAFAGPSWAADKPRRIVSINLCTDQLAMLLVAPERIVSLSFLAADPASSAMAAAAGRFRLNHGLAEEVLTQNPDIVLAGPHAARPAVDLLRRLGHRVFELPLGESLDDVPRHLRAVAQALGEDQRGEALIADFQSRLAAISRPPAGVRPLAALYAPNGITSGARSLPQAVMAAAGFDNLADRRAITGVGRVSLEDIVAARPDALIIGRLSVEHPSLAAQSLDHPALAAAVPGNAVIAVPHHVWACAIPQIADAVAALAGLRDRLGPPRGRP